MYTKDRVKFVIVSAAMDTRGWRFCLHHHYTVKMKYFAQN